MNNLNKQNIKEIVGLVWKYFPKSIIGIGCLVYISLIVLATQLGVAIRASIDARIARNELIASYDADKKEELQKAIDADEEAFDIQMWAKSCRDANILGTTEPANTCDLIQIYNAGIVQPKKEDTFIDTKITEVVKVKNSAYLNWQSNANGEAQAPVYVIGGSLDARMLSMLDYFRFDNRYSLTPNYGLVLFKKVGARYNIKPEVIICIAKADTLLGTATKSSYNIGNVGNNDRGSVVHYKDIGAGIDAIGKVLSNKYLGYKQTLGSLTPYGGGSSPFYATSPTGNWYNNVRNCLAELHDDPTINPDFLIRNK